MNLEKTKQLKYDESTNNAYIDTHIQPNRDVIVKVHQDGVSDKPKQHNTANVHQKGVCLDNLLSSDDTIMHTYISTRCNKWERLAKDCGIDVQQLEYRIAVMQKVIQQYDQKCDKIKRIAEAANERKKCSI